MRCNAIHDTATHTTYLGPSAVTRNSRKYDIGAIVGEHSRVRRGGHLDFAVGNEASGVGEVEWVVV